MRGVGIVSGLAGLEAMVLVLTELIVMVVSPAAPRRLTGLIDPRPVRMALASRRKPALTRQLGSAIHLEWFRPHLRLAALRTVHMHMPFDPHRLAQHPCQQSTKHHPATRNPRHHLQELYRER